MERTQRFEGYKGKADPNALKNRIGANDRGSLYDLEGWVIHQCEPHHGMQVLDLGCGTGKQIFRFADLVSSTGSILGIDISQQAVDEVNEKAKTKQLKKIRAIKASLDECTNLLQGAKFDLIMSCYAIYYANDMKRVICELRSLLNPNGHIFLCGPAKMNNQEMFNIINDVISDPSKQVEVADDFIDASSIEEISRHYQRFNTIRLDNKIQFDSVDNVLQWWKNHSSFIPEIYDSVENSLRTHFAVKGKFVLTKNILGLNYYS
jgi:SAM-dependent methyltransferase